MKGILTPEEKKYLRRVANYISSMGMYDGNIEFDIDSYSPFDPNDIEWDEEKGDLKINGKPALKMRLTKKLDKK